MTWHPHVDVWIVVALLGAGYAFALRRTSGDPGAAGGRNGRHIACFVSGLVVLWGAADWPIHELAENRLYSVHMVQHILLTLVVPPLFLAGLTPGIARLLLRPRPVFAVVRRLARPVPALLIFNGLIALTHWPLLVDAAVGSELIHFTIHAALFGSALLMWTPVLSPVMEIPRLSYPGQMLYLFLQSIVPTVPASFLTFAERPLYRAYAGMSELVGISSLTDQRTAGLIMKLVGGAILWAMIAVLFFKWYTIEQQKGVDVLQFRDVDRHVDRIPPRERRERTLMIDTDGGRRG